MPEKTTDKKENPSVKKGEDGRLAITPETYYPPLARMNFFRDQHKFSDWVYLAASANMAFWILLSWSIFSASHTMMTLFIMLAAAAVATFSPVILRRSRS